VTCVERGQKCQRDRQCCESGEPLVCQKETSFTVDGTYVDMHRAYSFTHLVKSSDFSDVFFFVYFGTVPRVSLVYEAYVRHLDS